MKPDFIIRILTLGLLLAASPLRAADETNSPSSSNSGLDYNSWDIISRRNIFSPNRRGVRIRDDNRTPSVRTDSFTLIGTMTYEKGRFAFFDGSSSDFRKPFKAGDSIGGYRIGDVSQNGITLLAANNKVINLPIGTQMRRRDRGPWELMSHAEPVTTTNPGDPGDFTARAAELNGAESDALKRLMMRRLKEQ